MRVAAIDCGTNSIRLLVADVDERSEIYRDEVFGPVLTVSSFTDDADALRDYASKFLAPMFW